MAKRQKDKERSTKDTHRTKDLAKCPKQIRPQAQTHFMLIIITLFSKPMLQRLQSECSNQYKVNTYHYINKDW
jgi:hypothetical protein